MKPAWGIIGAFLLGVVLTIAAGANAPREFGRLRSVGGNAFVDPNEVVAIHGDGAGCNISTRGGGVLYVNADPYAALEQLGLK